MLLACLLITLTVWATLRHQESEEVARDFERRCETVTAAVKREFSAYELVLRSTASMVAAAQNGPLGMDALSQPLWHDYAARLDGARTLPGINALGFAEPLAQASVPASAARLASSMPPAAAGSAVGSAVITRYIDPLNSVNRILLGYDQAANPARRAALELARDTGAIALAANPVPGAAGVDAIFPVYRSGPRPDSTAARRTALIGYVFAWIDARRTLEALTTQNLQDVQVAAYLDTASHQTLVYSQQSAVQASGDDGPFETDTVAVGNNALVLQYDGRQSSVPRRVSQTALTLGLIISFVAFVAMRVSGNKRHQLDRARQNAQLRVSQNEARMQAIVRAAVEAIITIDEDQNIVIFNPMAEHVFRCPAAEAIGSPLHRFIPERYRQAHAGHVTRFGVTSVSERVMGGQRSLSGLRADGEEFPIEASISQIHEAGRKLFTVMLRDITERLRAEAALEASRNELRQLSGNIQNVREQEKTRIARELHDDLGQQLTALKMDLSILESDLRKLPKPQEQASSGDAKQTATPNPATPDPVTLLSQTRNMHALLNSTVASVRRIAADLRPVMLDDLGLAPAIEWLVNDFEARYGITVQLEMNIDEFEFDSASATAIFRIVQEGFTNIARHAQASKVTLSLKRNAMDCVVQITDNGRGTDLSAAQAGKSFGLLGIRERVHLLGGQVELTSLPGKGLTLRVTLPEAAFQTARTNA
ncbi:CHASE domain-containing protein [Burkholderia sp. L27(2015)]|uniref:sensor histidine kinase n=1 Tax=Burkholderia sp. L27(2015) TaxID=1641858 RepID=UPI00131E6CFD|nr:CHASE domain-containing protein [Burkholderia sp. L27(2015)]